MQETMTFQTLRTLDLGRCSLSMPSELEIV